MNAPCRWSSFEQGLCHLLLLNRDLEGALLCRIKSLIEQVDYAAFELLKTFATKNLSISRVYPVIIDASPEFTTMVRMDVSGSGSATLIINF